MAALATVVHALPTNGLVGHWDFAGDAGNRATGASTLPDGILQGDATITAAVAPVSRTNGYIESFNGRLRDECLNREWFYTQRPVWLSRTGGGTEERSDDTSEAPSTTTSVLTVHSDCSPHWSLQQKKPHQPPSTSTSKAWANTRATPSFRPSLDSLYNLTLNHIINPLRLTLNAVQFA